MSFYWICMGDPAVQPVLQPLVSHALAFILFTYSSITESPTGYNNYRTIKRRSMVKS